MSRRILLVDDDRDITDAVAMLLELEGHEVRSATNGEGALQAIRSFAPDVAFLDWKLPDMSGAQLLARLKAQPGTAHTRFVLLSGFVDPEAMRGETAAAPQARFDKTLTKPATIEDLLACL
ncbi:response regulator [Paraburkholderia sp. J41]|uniref:response regulator n=1 Tax=Paraburkholderia sp. J41 TaxID=2805433 RepID=UPI002AC32C85|nr:response regulator [Paraburkholderia sp. J41]